MTNGISSRLCSGWIHGCRWIYLFHGCLAGDEAGWRRVWIQPPWTDSGEDHERIDISPAFVVLEFCDHRKFGEFVEGGLRYWSRPGLNLASTGPQPGPFCGVEIPCYVARLTGRSQCRLSVLPKVEGADRFRVPRCRLILNPALLALPFAVLSRTSFHGWPVGFIEVAFQALTVRHELEIGIFDPRQAAEGGVVLGHGQLPEQTLKPRLVDDFGHGDPNQDPLRRRRRCHVLFFVEPVLVVPPVAVINVRDVVACPGVFAPCRLRAHNDGPVVRVAVDVGLERRSSSRIQRNVESRLVFLGGGRERSEEAGTHGGGPSAIRTPIALVKLNALLFCESEERR